MSNKKINKPGGSGQSLMDKYKLLIPQHSDKALEVLIAGQDIPRDCNLFDVLAEDFSRFWSTRRLVHIVSLVPELLTTQPECGIDEFLVLVAKDVDERQKQGLDIVESFYAACFPEVEDDVRKMLELLVPLNELELEGGLDDSTPVDLESASLGDEFVHEEDSPQDRDPAHDAEELQDQTTSVEIDQTPESSGKSGDVSGDESANPANAADPDPHAETVPLEAPAEDDGSPQDAVESGDAPDNQPANAQPTNDVADGQHADESDGTADNVGEYTVLVGPQEIREADDSGASSARMTSGGNTTGGAAGPPASAPVTPAVQDPDFPIVPDHFIIRELGRGAYGRVYLAKQFFPNTKKLIQLVALKVLTKTGPSAECEKEVQIVARLNHPGIVRLFTTGLCEFPPGHALSQGQSKSVDNGGSPASADEAASGTSSTNTKKKYQFFTMEYVAGGTLNGKVNNAESEPLALRDLAKLMLEVCQGLSFAHEAKVRHGDLKTDNILLTDADEPKLADFGLAAMSTDQRAPLGGTYRYMAPEVASGDASRVGFPADVFSMGAILYELLTGTTPVSTQYVQERRRELVEKMFAPQKKDEHEGKQDADRNRLRYDISPPSELLRMSGRKVTDDFQSLEAISMMCLKNDPQARYAKRRRIGRRLAAILEQRTIAGSATQMDCDHHSDHHTAAGD